MVGEQLGDNQATSVTPTKMISRSPLQPVQLTQPTVQRRAQPAQPAQPKPRPQSLWVPQTPAAPAGMDISHLPFAQPTLLQREAMAAGPPAKQPVKQFPPVPQPIGESSPLNPMSRLLYLF